MEQAAAAPAANQDKLKTNGFVLIGLLALVFCMAAAAIVVGSVALNKINELDSDVEQLMLNKGCDGEPTLIQSATFRSLYRPSPTVIFVPAWNYTDPLWFHAPGNVMIYNKDPMYGEDDENFATPKGTLSGQCLVIKPETDFSRMHCYLTVQFNDIQGEAIVGGIHETFGNQVLPILGGWGSYWQSFSGYLEVPYNTTTGQVSAKVYQTCQ